MIIEIVVPKIGESLSEVTLAKILVPNGSYVAADTVLCEFESDKTNFELSAEKAGTVTFVVNEGDDLLIGALVCKIDTSAVPTSNVQTAPPPAQQNTAPPPPTQQTPTADNNNHYAANHPSPAAAKIIAENNLTQVQGTGKDGRITKEDALKQVQNQQNTVAPPPSTANQQLITSPPAANANRTETPEKLSRLRKTISRRLVQAKNTTAMLTTFNEVDMTEIINLRKKYKDTFQTKHGVPLGFMSFFVKAASIALLEFPEVNAYIDDEHIHFHNYVDISVAVSTDRGLVVPVIRDVQNLKLQDIEKAVALLAQKGRDNTLTMDDMNGGTFTVSNGGVFGSLMSTPILNMPQSAILGMHKTQERPVVLNGQIVARPMMYLALSYDHRIIDGKEAVTFLVRIKELLEDPTKLLLEL